MQRCKTCVFWSRDGECENMPQHDVSYNQKMQDDAKASIEIHQLDDQGLTVCLITRADFGCVNHQPKEA